MAEDIPVVPTPAVWRDRPDATTPITAAALNARDAALRTLIERYNLGEFSDAQLEAIEALAPPAEVTPAVVDPIIEAYLTDNPVVEAGTTAGQGQVWTGSAWQARTVRARSSQMKLAALGDSMTACDNGTNFEWNPSNGIYDTNSSWLLQAVLASSGRIEYGGNFGVPGETSAAILARVPDVIAAAPTHCTVLAGANDAGATTVRASVTSIVNQLQAANIVPVLVTLPPHRTLTDMALMTKIRAVNAFVRGLASDRGLPLVDFYAVLADPATGDYKAGLYQDATHFARAAYPVVAAQLLSVLDSSATTRAYARVDNTLLGQEKVANGLFLNFTADAPDNWTTVLADANVVASQADDSDFAGGKALQLVGSGTASKNYLLQHTATGIGGDNMYELSLRMKLSGMGVAESGHPVIELTTGANVNFRRVRFRLDASGRFVVRFANPAGNNTIKVNLRWQNTNAGTVTFRLGEVSLRDITALAAA